MIRLGILGAVLAVLSLGLGLWPAPAGAATGTPASTAAGTAAGTAADEDGIWLDIFGCKIWVENKRDTIDTKWEGTCRPGKAAAIGSFTRKYKDARSRIVVETYSGRWIEGRQQGKGRYENTLGVLYDGTFEDGLPDGKGIYRWADGASYEGEWVADRRSGWGVYLGTKGDNYEGGFRDGEFDGLGIMNWAAGLRFEGAFKNGSPHGKGVLFIATGDEVHGEFRGNMLLGAGRCWRAKVDRWFDCAQDGARVENLR